MNWVVLFFAGLLEIVWALGLKSTEGFTKFWPSVGTLSAMGVSFFLLSQALRTIPVGTGYAVWTGIGAVGTAIIGMAVLGEPREVGRIVCLLMIIGGIVGLKMFSPH
ncbi:quaternary ammonium compound efflux SMR transporter SugE [bacterium]|nr:MAG: quaternary ammonium compound efflux SMR transporter SugE [bacterium]